MIIEIVVSLGPTLAAGGASAFITHRAVQFRKAIRRGVEMHPFKPKTYRMDWQVITSKYCDTCQKTRGAWIHDVHSDDDDISVASRIFELEAKDIEWRFANDPEWVKVFGEEYDPKTFLPIPQFHNGECGGPNDSCERCAWEADQAETTKENARHIQKIRDYNKRKEISESERRLVEAEYKGYIEILVAIWEDLDQSEDALEEFDDIRDEIGMLKNNDLRNKIKASDIFKQLEFCLRHPEKRWKRREEVWQTERKRQAGNYKGYDLF